MITELNDTQVDIRRIGSAPGVWDFSFSDYPICRSRWRAAFALLRKLAGYKRTAADAQRIGNALLAAYNRADDATCDALAADAARLVGQL